MYNIGIIGIGFLGGSLINGAFGSDINCTNLIKLEK